MPSSKDTRAITGIFEKEVERYRAEGYTWLGKDFPRTFYWERTDGSRQESSWGRFEKPLGKGNFGFVYALRLHPDHILRREISNSEGYVAVKVLHDKITDEIISKVGKEEAFRLLNDAANNLRKEGIIGLKLCKDSDNNYRKDMPACLPKYFGQDTTSKDFSYLMMEYVPHKVTLDNYVINDPDDNEEIEEKKDFSVIPIYKTIAIAKRLIIATDYAHKSGITHFDINPRNILMNEEAFNYSDELSLEQKIANALIDEDLSSVKLIDFGLGTYPDDTDDSYGLKGSMKRTFTARMFGTAWYVSPENANFRALEYPKNCDLYSIGATLYALATGRPPFQGDPRDIVALVNGGSAANRIVHPKKLNPEVPWWFNDFIMKLLLYNVKYRIQPEEMLSQFEKYSLEGLSI